VPASGVYWLADSSRIDLGDIHLPQVGGHRAIQEVARGIGVTDKHLITQAMFFAGLPSLPSAAAAL
jgi:hypothetical protein